MYCPMPAQVEFRYWGLQSKVERFIHDYGLRRVMLRAHRQAWAWQDEWEGLTMRDIRRLERETQLILQKKLGRVPKNQQLEEEEEEGGGEGEGNEDKQDGEGGDEKEGGMEERREGGESGRIAIDHMEMSTDSHPHQLASHPPHSPTSSASHHRHHSFPTPSSPPLAPPLALNKSTSDGHASSTAVGHEPPKNTIPMVRKGSLQMGRKRELRRDRSNLQCGAPRTGQLRRPDTLLPMSRSHSRVEGDSDGESMYSARPEWALDSIAISDTDSELEFFDARGEIEGLLFKIRLVKTNFLWEVQFYPVCVFYRDSEWSG